MVGSQLDETAAGAIGIEWNRVWREVVWGKSVWRQESGETTQSAEFGGRRCTERFELARERKNGSGRESVAGFGRRWQTSRTSNCWYRQPSRKVLLTGWIMKRTLLVIAVIVLYVLHQDVWFWRTARPLVFGFVPIGLFYQACFCVAASLLMWLLVTFAWPSQLEHEIEQQRSEEDATS